MESNLLHHVFEAESSYRMPERLTKANDWHAHIPFAFWLTEKLMPHTFVELGVFRGDSFSAICQSVTQNKIQCQAFGIDTWQGDLHTGEYDENVYQELWEYIESNFASFARLIRMTFDEALPMFDDHSIDLLHIDGLHTKDAVTNDFKNWLPKMSGRGVIIFHDTNVYTQTYGVWRLWKDVCSQYPSFEFTHGNGLGILAVGDGVPAPIQLLTHASDEEKKIVVNFFAALGERIRNLSFIEYWKYKQRETYNAYQVCANQLQSAKENHHALIQIIADTREAFLNRMNDEWNRQFNGLVSTLTESNSDLRAKLDSAFDKFLSELKEQISTVTLGEASQDQQE